MPNNKRQHFVPKFLLRKFSKNENAIDLFQIPRQHRVQKASLKTQCYGDYLYGQGPDIFTGLESEIAAMFQHDLQTDFENLNEGSKENLRFFVHVQNWRTTRAAELMDVALDQFWKETLSRDPRAAGQDFSKVRIGSTHPQLSALQSAITTYFNIVDLEFKFLINEREIEFLISDHPVLLLNQWAQSNQGYKANEPITGLASKGLLKFLPLGPQL